MSESPSPQQKQRTTAEEPQVGGEESVGCEARRRGYTATDAGGVSSQLRVCCTDLLDEQRKPLCSLTLTAPVSPRPHVLPHTTQNTRAWGESCASNQRPDSADLSSVVQVFREGGAVDDRLRRRASGKQTIVVRSFPPSKAPEPDKSTRAGLYTTPNLTRELVVVQPQLLQGPHRGNTTWNWPAKSIVVQAQGHQRGKLGNLGPPAKVMTFDEDGNHRGRSKPKS